MGIKLFKIKNENTTNMDSIKDIENIETEKKTICLPEIPNSWLIALVLVGLVILRAFGIDTFVTAGLSVIIGYLTGVKQEQIRKEKVKLP